MSACNTIRSPSPCLSTITFPCSIFLLTDTVSFEILNVALSYIFIHGMWVFDLGIRLEYTLMKLIELGIQPSSLTLHQSSTTLAHSRNMFGDLFLPFTTNAIWSTECHYTLVHTIAGPFSRFGELIVGSAMIVLDHGFAFFVCSPLVWFVIAGSSTFLNGSYRAWLPMDSGFNASTTTMPLGYPGTSLLIVICLSIAYILTLAAALVDRHLPTALAPFNGMMLTDCYLATIHAFDLEDKVKVYREGNVMNGKEEMEPTGHVNRDSGNYANDVAESNKMRKYK